MRILIVEDSEDDALLLILRLRQAGNTPIYERVQTLEKLRAALDHLDWDIIISDYVLPGFSGLDVLQMIYDRGLDIPCIVVSGKISDETAANVMRAGARDFISKDNLSRLGPAIERELKEAAIRRERYQAEKKLKETNDLNAILLANSPLAMMAVNPDSSIRYVNQTTEKLTGFSSAELIGSKAPYPFWPPTRCRQYLEEMKNDSFTRVKVQQKVFCTRQGEEFWVEMTLIPIKIAGKLEYILSSWINLTQEMKLRKELELFNHKIIRAQEEERKRIVRELHEDTVQLLAIIKLELEALSKSQTVQSEETIEKLQYLQNNTNHAMRDISRLSYALRPGELDHLGLDTALEQLVEDAAEQLDLSAEFQVNGISRRLANDIELVLFRITQEALSNIQKHAHATRALIEMKYLPDKVRLMIEDNGEGFNLEKETETAAGNGRLGIIGMRERAHLINAEFKIEARQGSGTTITVELKT